jgi:flagellar motor switch protein FliM
MSEPPDPASRVRRLLFFDDRRPTRTWMPTLEAIDERFAQHCRAILLQDLQSPVEVTPQFPIEVVRHDELSDRLATPSHLTLARLKPLYGTMLIAVEAELVGIIVESRYGGSGRLPRVAMPNREFAPLEYRTMCRVVERLLAQWALAWHPVATLIPEIARHEVKPSFAAIAAAAEMVIVSVFAVTVGNGTGKLTIAIPHSMLEPVHDRLVRGAVERGMRDPDWSEQLAAGVADATTELKVELATIEITVRDFLSLRPGSVFEIARPDTVTVQSRGLPLFRGSWGRQGRKIAIRVEDRLAVPANPSAAASGGATGDRIHDGG